MDRQDVPAGPLSPEDRRQIELRRAAEEKERQIIEQAARLEAKHGDELRGRITQQHMIDDPAVRDRTVQNILRDVAEGKRSYEDMKAPQIEEQLGKAQAQEKERQEAEKARQQAVLIAEEKTRQTEMESREQARETAERAAQQARRAEPIPGAVDRFNASLAQSKADQAERHGAAVDRARPSSGNRPNYTRFEGMKSEQAAVTNASSTPSRSSESETGRGEISDAKAARLSRLEASFQQRNDGAQARQDGRGSEGKGGSSRGRA